MRVAPVVLCALLVTACKFDADFSDNIQVRTLNPDEYRTEIASVDNLLFRPVPLGDAGVRDLGNVLSSLSQRVATIDAKSKFLKIESLELKLLAKRAERLSPDGTGAALQNDWMRIRNNLFDDRWWFARSAADLEQTSTTAAATTTTAAVTRRETVYVPPHVYAERAAITGRWRAVSIVANGQPRTDAELTGSVWTFDPPRLIAQDGAGHTTTYNFAFDGSYLIVTTAAGQDGFMRYEMQGDGTLRIAFFDGMVGKPTGFERDPARNDPLLVVVTLARE